MAKRQNDARPVATPATPATRAADEWGLPDWRDPEAYGDVERWSYYRWRWEFYRRRDDLRAYFDARAEATYRDGWQIILGQPEPLRPDQPGFVVKADRQAWELFGYRKIPNPRIGEQPAESLEMRKHEGVAEIVPYFTNPLRVHLSLDLLNQTEQGAAHAFAWAGLLGEAEPHEALARAETPEDRYAEKRELTLTEIGRCRPVPLRRGEYALVFDENRPIEPQLEHARRFLKRQQKQKFGKLMRANSREDKWRRWTDYLRALDAKESGATLSQIVQILPPEIARDDSKAAANFLEQARDMKFWF